MILIDHFLPRYFPNLFSSVADRHVLYSHRFGQIQSGQCVVSLNQDLCGPLD